MSSLRRSNSRRQQRPSPPPPPPSQPLAPPRRVRRTNNSSQPSHSPEASFLALAEDSIDPLDPVDPSDLIDGATPAEEAFSVNCPCGLETDVAYWIQCEECLSWQHGPCVGYPDEDKAPEHYWCRTCRPPPKRRAPPPTEVSVRPAKRGRRPKEDAEWEALPLSAHPSPEAPLPLDPPALSVLEAKPEEDTGPSTPSTPITSDAEAPMTPSRRRDPASTHVHATLEEAVSPSSRPNSPAKGSSKRSSTPSRGRSSPFPSEEGGRGRRPRPKHATVAAIRSAASPALRRSPSLSSRAPSPGRPALPIAFEPLQIKPRKPLESSSIRDLLRQAHGMMGYVNRLRGELADRPALITPDELWLMMDKIAEDAGSVAQDMTRFLESLSS